MSIADWIGTIGVSIILLAYYLNVSGKIKNDTLTFILLNLIGAGLAGFASWLIRYIPFVILEVVWALVSLNSLFIYVKNKS